MTHLNRFSDLSAHLTKYALTAGAALLAGGSTAEAGVIVRAINETVDSTNNLVLVDVNGDGLPDVVLSMCNCGQALYLDGAPNVGASYTTYPYASALGFGVQIDPNITGFGPAYLMAEVYNTLDYGEWRDKTAFIGLKFTNFDTGDVNAGWIRVTVDYLGDPAEFTALITHVGYETDAGVSLMTDHTVPEPSTLGMLAAGALGLAAYRRRKAAA